MKLSLILISLLAGLANASYSTLMFLSNVPIPCPDSVKQAVEKATNLGVNKKFDVVLTAVTDAETSGGSVRGRELQWICRDIGCPPGNPSGWSWCSNCPRRRAMQEASNATETLISEYTCEALLAAGYKALALQATTQGMLGTIEGLTCAAAIGTVGVACVNV